MTRIDEPVPALDAAANGVAAAELTKVAPDAVADPAPRAKASRRVAITTIDQGFSSASNFAVGVVVAHIAGPAGLGAYAVAYTAWLALGTAHRALITDPMSIDNDVLHADAAQKLRAGLAAETSIGLAAAAVLVVVSIPLIFSGLRSFGIALITLAPFLPFLLVQDYWRWVGFMQARPDRSLMNDVVFNCVQALGVGALIVGGLRSPSVAIVAWGVGAAVAAAYGLRQYSVGFTLRGGAGMIRSRWPMSKWFFAGGLASWGSAQAYPLLAGPGVGPVGLGGLKAAQNLMSGPTLVLIQAGGSIGLPEASHALERGGWPRLRSVAGWVTVAGVVSVGFVAAIVFVAGEPHPRRRLRSQVRQVHVDGADHRARVARPDARPRPDPRAQGHEAGPGVVQHRAGVARRGLHPDPDVLLPLGRERNGYCTRGDRRGDRVGRDRHVPPNRAGVRDRPLRNVRT